MALQPQFGVRTPRHSFSSPFSTQSLISFHSVISKLLNFSRPSSPQMGFQNKKGRIRPGAWALTLNDSKFTHYSGRHTATAESNNRDI
jgi:hypothetical protein